MKNGKLAQIAGKDLPLQVMESAKGFYIGTVDKDGSPFSRESLEYYKSEDDTEKAFSSGNWTQRIEP